MYGLCSMGSTKFSRLFLMVFVNIQLQDNSLSCMSCQFESIEYLWLLGELLAFQRLQQLYILKL